jgi:hypothetical protein
MAFLTVWQIIRRAGWLRRQHYNLVIPRPEDNGPELQRKWELWVQQETKKRYVKLNISAEPSGNDANH